MNDERVQRYADMWTHELGRYALVELDPTRPSTCAIKDLVSGGLVVIDDDDDIIEAILVKMRAAGAPVMTLEEARPK